MIDHGSGLEHTHELGGALNQICASLGRDVGVMHVSEALETAIISAGVRDILPENLRLIMGPGSPACTMDEADIDEAVVLARQGAIVCASEDVMRVAGSVSSLSEEQARGAGIRVVGSAAEASRVAAAHPSERVVYFGCGFETAAVETAAAVLAEPPYNFSILSAHRFLPRILESVAETRGNSVQGFLMPGDAASITGFGIYDRLAARHQAPVVIARFEPQNILEALVQLVSLIRDAKASSVNAGEQDVSKTGDLKAQCMLWRVFEPVAGARRSADSGAHGSIGLRDEYSWMDARERFFIDRAELRGYEAHARRPGGRCLCGREHGWRPDGQKMSPVRQPVHV